MLFLQPNAASLAGYFRKLWPGPCMKKLSLFQQQAVAEHLPCSWQTSSCRAFSTAVYSSAECNVAACRQARRMPWISTPGTHSLTCQPGFLPTSKRAWWESDLYQLLLPCRGRWGAWPFESFLPYQRTTFEARAALFKTDFFFFKFSPQGPHGKHCPVLSAFTCQQQVCVLRSLLDGQPFEKEASYNKFRSWALTKIGTEQVNSQFPCKSWNKLFKQILC